MRDQNTCRDDLVLLDRVVLSSANVKKLKRLFKMLANDTRLRMLQALIRSGELCVNELARALAMKPQAISNQLQRLVDQGILESRREGNNIYYQIVDPCIPQIFDRALCLMEMAKRTAKPTAITARKRA